MVIKKGSELKLVSFLLRAGLALVFLYAGLAALLNPTSWVGFIPAWLQQLIPARLFLPAHAVLDIIIGLWLIMGKQSFYAAAVASLSLLSIIIFNLGALDIVFRDVAILFSAVAIMVLHFSEVK